MSQYFHEPVYKIQFWSGSTLLRGFGYGYNNKEVVAFKIKPGLTNALGSFEITIVDTGSGGTGLTTGNAFANIEIFSTVKMWWGYTGSGLSPTAAEMFTGKIDTKEVTYSEGGCLRTFIGRDSGEPLIRILERRSYTGSLSGSATALKDKSGLSALNTYISQSTDIYSFVLDNTNCFDGLIEISNFDNKDFYVDTGSNLHWFERQSLVDSETTFVEGMSIFSYRYVKDLPDVKNDIYVFGLSDSSPLTGSYWLAGHDGYTEITNPTGSWTAWYQSGSSEIDAMGGLYVWNKILDSRYVFTGSYSIFSEVPPTNVGAGTYVSHLYLDLTTGSPTGKSLMLNNGDILHLATLSQPVGFNNSLFPSIRLVTKTGSERSGGDYLECILEERANNDYVWSERTINVGPSYEGISATGSSDTTTGSYRWTRHGNPDWYDIKGIDIKIGYVSEAGPSRIFSLVDYLYFGTSYQAHSSGSASINAYGLRPEVINNNKINSNLYAKNYADTTLTLKQIPSTNIEIEAVTRTYQVGTSYPIIINSEGINSNFELIDLEHRWENNRLTSKCTFTNQPQIRIPIPIMNYPVQQAVNQYEWMKKLADWMYKIPNRY